LVSTFSSLPHSGAKARLVTTKKASGNRLAFLVNISTCR
jgi:hypothetical protein